MNPDHHWRQLAQLASSEADPKKLTELSGHLCDALDQQLSCRLLVGRTVNELLPPARRIERPAKGLSSDL